MPAGARVDRRWLAPLFVLFIAKQLLLVGIVGPFTGHDEVDHFFYVARLADGDGLGIVGEVDLPRAARRYFAYVADKPHNAEVIQPPLYHLLLAPLYLAIPGGTLGKLYALRVISVLVGALVVWLAYLTARLLFPGDALIRAGVPIFVAFQPQFSFEAAIVNHDILLILLFSLAIYLLLRGLRDGFTPARTLVLGLVGAAGLWTKVSFGLVLPVVALGLWLGWRQRRPPVPALIGDLTRAVVLPVLLILPWFLRSYRLYGDPTGAERLKDIPQYGDQANDYWEMIWSKPFWRDRLKDFWGEFGWRLVPLDPRDYDVIWLIWGLAGVALLTLPVLALVRRRRRLPPLFTPLQRRGLVLMLLSFVLLIYGVLYVGTIQFTQSRFVFPGMIGIATLSLIGVDRWLPARARPYALPVLAALLLALNAYTVLRYLIPFFYGPGGGALINP